MAPHTSEPINIDGNIYKQVWEDVPWSEDFEEIRGDDAPEEDRPTARTRTRMKIRWDDDYLYIAAEMTSNGWPIVAEFKDRNSPIFQKDSDFEVFVDTDGSNLNYKELELNAFNTVWNLMMDRPYSSGGQEYSGRVAKEGDARHWDVKEQKTHTRLPIGKLNQVSSEARWTAEIALKHKETLQRTRGRHPAVGRWWRINFSRVERKGRFNWVWSPMVYWDPKAQRNQGVVNMHAPDAWGWIRFVEEDAPMVGRGPRTGWTEPAWPLREAASQLFYAEQFALSKEGGGTLLDMHELLHKGLVNATLFQSLDLDVSFFGSGSSQWTAQIRGQSSGLKPVPCIATVQWDHGISLECGSIFSMLGPFTSLILATLLLGVVGALGSYFIFRKPGSLPYSTGFGKPNAATD